ncbi:MAG: SpoIID/LytB domain-containing protein [Clostridia bacterium]|nr:SpoIID/LytB domain-containing protein [Clostridia bacterium]
MKKNWFTLMTLLLAVCLSACSMFPGAEEEIQPEASKAPVLQGEIAVPSLPDGLETRGGVPVLTVYDTANETYEEMDVERYVMGVLAGEMRNDWPMEALKAQAILARTFVLKFIDEKESAYEGADISTDIKEAQAYSAEKINERIEKAVSDTRGEVLSVNGELPYAWFHAHAGGMTELPTLALDYKEADPVYTQAVESPDSDKAPTSVKSWTVSFPADEVAQAAKASGTDVGKITSIELGEKGESGRTAYFLINGKKVSAPSLRINLDSTKLKSTLLSSVSMDNGRITFTGSGYGHGVGMSQWGAYGMAEQGKTAEEIVSHYFRNAGVARVW